MIYIIDNTFNIDKNFYKNRLKQIVKTIKLRGHITVKLGDKEECRQLNTQFLERDYPTDVLSFPCRENLPGGFYLGDIFICHPVAGEQATENHIPLELELFTLMVHGILHLAGHDHEKDSGEMLHQQEELVNKYFNPDQGEP